MQTVAPRLRTVLLLFLFVTGTLLTGAAPASAHAALTGSDPERGSVVDTAPEQVSVTFSENVALADDSLRVLDPRGNRADTGPTSEVGATSYSVKLKPGLPNGTFTVTYQVVSADSHPVAGAFTFSVGAPSKTSVAVPDQTAGGGVVGTLYDIGRYVSYAGYVLMVGGAVFVLACWPRGSGVRSVQRVVVGGWLALVAATLWLLGTRGAYLTSGSPGDLFDLKLLGEVLPTKTGAALVSRLLLLAAAALFIAVLFGVYARTVANRDAAPGEDERTEGPGDGNGAGDGARDVGVAERDLTFGLGVGGVVVAAGIAATWALSEHASTGIQTGLAMPLDVVHLLAVAAWLGGLVTLVTALYRAPSIDAAAVRRFSALAFGSVVVLAVTGLYQSWRQVGSWSGLTGTDYGRLLLLKVGLVAVVLAVAWFSRRWTARLSHRPAGTAPENARAAEDTAGTDDPAADDGTVRTAPDPTDTDPTDTEPTDTEPTDTDPTSTDAPGTERAAQLARQRTAVATARVKRARDADPARSGLRRSVLAETSVAVVLLAVTTVLTTTEPARTQEAAERATTSGAARSGPLSVEIPFDTGSAQGKGLVTVDLAPGSIGSNGLHVYVERPNGSGYDVPEIKVAFTLKEKDIGPLAVAPDRIATAHWSASGVQLPVAGEWEIAVTVRTSDIDQVTVKKNVKIG
ncbi:copper resistance CopC/CopD family protein [Streptomyces sp. NPDC127068]|uniref:copper resistance CopC/CopD family protein n=1 Tax=Streptomyces sp. NPDC127068 TaxID=3347127 RepID=UPI00365964BF